MDKQLRKSDMGLTGAIIILCQVISSLQTSRNLSSEFDELKFQFLNAKAEQEQYFVKKEELKKVSFKLDSMNDRLDIIQKQIKFLKDFAWSEPQTVIGCALHKTEWRFHASKPL